MNLQGIASAVTSIVSPNEFVLMAKSTGYVTGADGKLTPTYAAPVRAVASMQALQFQDITLLNNLNIQGIRYAAYMQGEWEGIDRKRRKGGDLMTRADGSKWLVAVVLERWDNDGKPWRKLAMTEQLDA